MTGPGRRVDRAQEPGAAPGVGTLAALGDSTSCGQGVGVRVALERTWPALLAGDLGARHLSFARPGARLRDLAEQVEPARLARPDLVTLFIGLNDVLRSGPCAVDELGGVLEPFGPATRLIVRLHDPTLLLRLPQPFRQALRHRVSLVNAAVDEAARTSGATVLDLAGVGALRHREAWALDRLHPSAHGHAVIAAAALSALGRPTGLLAAPGRPTRLREELRWAARHGVPYLARNGHRLAPGALGLARPRPG